MTEQEFKDKFEEGEKQRTEVLIKAKAGEEGYLNVFKGGMISDLMRLDEVDQFRVYNAIKKLRREKFEAMLKDEEYTYLDANGKDIREDWPKPQGEKGNIR